MKVSSTKQSFENISYVSYTQSSDFDDLPIEHKQFFSKNHHQMILHIIL